MSPAHEPGDNSGDDWRWDDPFARQLEAPGGGDRTPIYRILAEYTPLKDLDLYAALAPANLSPDGALSTDSLRADQEFWVQRGLVPQPADLAAWPPRSRCS